MTETQQRVFRGGEFVPTVPRSGSVDENAVWRVENMVRRGNGTNRYWECLGGARDLSLDTPLVPLTGTVSVTEGSAIVEGVGTLFLTECSPGQRIIIIPDDNTPTIPIFVKRVISDTQYEAWRESEVTIDDQIGQRMYRFFPLNQRLGMILWGNAIELDKGSILFVGDGELFINGASLPGGPANATREPRIALFQPDGTYEIAQLGMPQPPTPALSAVGGGTKGMQGGNYSGVLFPARKQTGGFNNPSLRADVTIATGDKIRITLPAMDAATKQNSWHYYGTMFNQTLGADLQYLNGPWRFVVEITDEMVSSAGGTFDVEYLDAEISGNELASFDNDPPPQALFVEMLNFTPIWGSCRGPSFRRGSTDFIDPSPGPMIAPSKQTNTEVAPAGVQFATSPPETIIGMAEANGRIFLLTPNHLQITQSTPDDRVPALVRPFERNGFGAPENLCVVDGVLYMMSNWGFTRSRSDLDFADTQSIWAANAKEIVKDWEAGHVLVAQEPNDNAVYFFRSCDELNGAGFWTTFAMIWGLEEAEWIGAARFTDDTRDMILSGVATVGDVLHLAFGGRKTI